MKKCSKCEKIYDDTWSVCLRDSVPLVLINKSEAGSIDLIKAPQDVQKESVSGIVSSHIRKAIAVSFVFYWLNIMAGAIGAVWLLFLKEGMSVTAGIAWSFIAPLLYFVMSITGLPMIRLCDYFAEKKKGGLLGLAVFLHMALSNIARLALVIFVIHWVLRLSQDNAVPYLLYGYFATFIGLQGSYQLSPERFNNSWVWIKGMGFGLFFMQITYILVAISFLLELSILGPILSVLLIIYMQIHAILIASAICKGSWTNV